MNLKYIHKEDLDELTKAWDFGTDDLTSWFSSKIFKEYSAAQDYAYLLGLNRGRENCLDVVDALKDIVELWDTMVPTIYINDMHLKARAALSKFQGDNHE
jgi:hypothetical protein